MSQNDELIAKIVADSFNRWKLMNIIRLILPHSWLLTYQTFIIYDSLATVRSSPLHCVHFADELWELQTGAGRVAGSGSGAASQLTHSN